MSERQLILSAAEVQQKIKRIALEIIEDNFYEKSIYICGINIRGNKMSNMIVDHLKKIDHNIEIKQCHLEIDLADLLNATIHSEETENSLKNKVIVLVDDVADTGRTLQFAIRPFLHLKPKKIQIAVLVDRMHKAYPVCADFVGFSLSTTMKEHIEVIFKPKENVSVFLT